MATEGSHTDELDAAYHPWVAAVVGGLAAGTGMGVVLSVGTQLMPLIGALYGAGTFLGGWVAHLANSVFFALVFSFALSRAVVRRETFPLATYVGIGLGYGAFLGLVTGGVLFPLWLNAGVQADVPVPFLPLPDDGTFFVTTLVLGVAHLVYGAILGFVYAVLSRSASIGPFE